jgi:hypothetical protein
MLVEPFFMLVVARAGTLLAQVVADQAAVVLD